MLGLQTTRPGIRSHRQPTRYRRSPALPHRLPFDAALAQRMSDRAVKVITATEAGDLLPRAFNDPTHFECRMCAWQDRCWRTQA